MKPKPLEAAARVVPLLVLLLLHGTLFAGQNPDHGWETRPKVIVATEVMPRTRIETWGERQHGINFSFQRWRTGTLLNYRVKPILRAHQTDIDAEKEHYLVFGGGYEYLHTVENGSTRIENRVITQVTPHVPIAGVLLSNRNRGEFRWVNGVYDFRYRNRIVLSRPTEAGRFRFTPYGSGEVYYDRNHHSWNQNQSALGVQFPYKKELMLDVYLLHQNCTTCGTHSVNMLGLTLNLYFRQR